MNKIVRFTFTMLLVIVLTACASPAQTSPTSVEAISTPIPPTAISATTSPTKSNFMNALVYDTPEMYDIPIETVQYPTPGGKTDTLSMDIFYPARSEARKTTASCYCGKWFSKQRSLE